MSRILIVEDDPAISKAYYTILKKEGFDVFAASNGDDGEAAVTAFKPDIIILDMLMPTTSGLDFLRQTDLPTVLPNTKVIAFSNVDNARVKDEAMALGAFRFLTKADYTPKQLVEVIRETLRG